jgi:hypothetical protein
MPCTFFGPSNNDSTRLQSIAKMQLLAEVASTKTLPLKAHTPWFGSCGWKADVVGTEKLAKIAVPPPSSRYLGTSST